MDDIHTPGCTDRPSDRVESVRPGTPQESRTPANKANDYGAFHSFSSRRRIGAAKLREIEHDLSPRDRRILADLKRLRVLSGSQLERLHFQTVAEGARGRARRRVLRRLVHLSLVTTLDRQIGGIRAGSAGLIYTLTGAGHRLLTTGEAIRRRNPTTPGQLFLEHALAISELYAQLAEQAPNHEATVVAFTAEGDAAWLAPDRHGQLVPLRPDAYLVLATNDLEDVWWIEVDRATESLPRLRSKLDAYVRLARSGRDVPGGLMPRVLITVPHEHRRAGVNRVLRSAKAPDGLLQVVLHDQATDYLLAELHGGEIDKPP